MRHTLISILALAAVSLPAFAQTHSHPAEDEGLHNKFYNSWNQPPHRRYSCCHDKDCYPTPIRLDGDRYYAQRREDLRWIPIPDGVLEQHQEDEGNIRQSPDHLSHACMPGPDYSENSDTGGDTLFCATLGEGA